MKLIRVAKPRIAPAIELCVSVALFFAKSLEALALAACKLVKVNRKAVEIRAEGWNGQIDKRFD